MISIPHPYTLLNIGGIFLLVIISLLSFLKRLKSLYLVEFKIRS